MFIRVKITAIAENTVTVKMADGTMMNWQQPSGTNQWQRHQIGDELVMTLTSNIDIINELLTDTSYVNQPTTPQHT